MPTDLREQRHLRVLQPIGITSAIEVFVMMRTMGRTFCSDRSPVQIASPTTDARA
jgi:hypothetical protein